MNPQIRCLWIARYIPFPSGEGAQIYSANLALSLARAGAYVRFFGFGDAGAAPQAATSVEWVGVPGKKNIAALAALRRLPFAAAIDATPLYQSMLQKDLEQSWDAIVLDGYGTGWALERCLKHCAAARGPRPVLAHVSHNHEEVLWRAMGREARGNPLKRLMLRLNVAKVAALEQRLVRAVDLLTTITDEDRDSLGASLGVDRLLTLTPGYAGSVNNARHITAATPRRVIIMGSFGWVVKQANLVRFLEIADPAFERAGIQLDVVGNVPKALLTELQARCKATHFHGFVHDVAPYLDRARIGIVPEAIGGGFKLKFLDYIFGRVPVATLSQAAAGLSKDLHPTMMASDTMEELVNDIVRNIDRLDELNRMQEQAYALGAAQFDWKERGEKFLHAIEAARERAADGLEPTKGRKAAGLPDAGLAVN